MKKIIFFKFLCVIISIISLDLYCADKTFSCLKYEPDLAHSNRPYYRLEKNKTTSLLSLLNIDDSDDIKFLTGVENEADLFNQSIPFVMSLNNTQDTTTTYCSVTQIKTTDTHPLIKYLAFPAYYHDSQLSLVDQPCTLLGLEPLDLVIIGEKCKTYQITYRLNYSGTDNTLLAKLSESDVKKMQSADNFLICLATTWNLDVQKNLIKKQPSRVFFVAIGIGAIALFGGLVWYWKFLRN